ncbi:MAG: lysylphosphatidylglycerol synthase transmembrane domain-containing protein [Chitinophagales bacterium]|nr:lysylphosphatidylglycerol synthase transmembrane domain-containing protein [Chitinophagales bacterium]
MKFTPKTLLLLVLFMGLGIGLVVYKIGELTPDQRKIIVHSLTSANYFWVALSLLTGFVSHFSRAARWNMLMQPMGYEPKMKNTVAAVMTGYMINFAIPRAGEVFRCGVINRYEKVPLQRVVGTMVTERIVDVLGLLMVFVLAFLLEFDVLYGYFQTNVFNKVGSSGGSKIPGGYGLIIAAIIGISLLIAFRFLRGYLEKLHIYHRFKAFIKGFLEGIKSIRHLRSPFWFIVHTVIIYTCYFLMMYLCFFSMPETAGLSAGAGLALLAISSIAMIITPGGIGAYPLFVQAGLMIYGINKEIGYSFGWLVWSAQFIGIMVGGLLALIILPIMNPDVKPKDDPETTALLENI